MDILDSNVWIWGLTQECEPAEALIDTVIHEESWIAVSAYIFEEVMQNLARADQPQKTIDRVQTRFAEIVHENSHIHAPSIDAVRSCDLETIRGMHAYKMIAAAHGIQVKDAPVLSFGHEWAQKPATHRPGDDPVVIYTADHSFAQFDATENYDRLEVRYVEC